MTLFKNLEAEDVNLFQGKKFLPNNPLVNQSDFLGMKASIEVYLRNSVLNHARHEGMQAEPKDVIIHWSHFSNSGGVVGQICDAYLITIRNMDHTHDS